MKDKIDLTKEAGPQQLEQSRNFTYLYLYGIKRAFIDSLRIALSNPDMPREFRYSENSEQSQIQIYRNDPSRVEKLPFISVKSGSGESTVDFLGDQLEGEQEIVKVNGQEYFYVYGGSLTLDMTVTLATAKPRELESLTDLILAFMRFVFMGTFQNMNIAYNSLKVSGEEVEDGEEGESLKYYKNIITTKITADFSSYLPKQFVELIESIKIQLAATI